MVSETRKKMATIRTALTEAMIVAVGEEGLVGSKRATDLEEEEEGEEVVGGKVKMERAGEEEDSRAREDGEVEEVVNVLTMGAARRKGAVGDDTTAMTEMVMEVAIKKKVRESSLVS